MVITTALAWLATRVGKYVATGVLVVGTFGGWLLLHDHKIRTMEKNVVLNEVTKKAKDLDAKGLRARQAADGPGATDWLRKFDCRDCP